MESMEPPDIHYLRAAEGWLMLGNSREAHAELERIDPQWHRHPEVLKLRFEIYGKADRWNDALETAKAMITVAPERAEGWINRSNALHFMRLYQAAHEHLLPALEKFPDNPHMRYNMACFCCRMQRLDEARQWLKLAFAMKGGEDLKKMALEDPDLEPLRAELSSD